MEVAVHVEPHDAEVVGARDVRDDALPALPLLRHPHPHVPVPELGRGDCYSHSGDSLCYCGHPGTFLGAHTRPSPFGPSSVDGYVPSQVTACPKSILLGHPSQYKHRDSPSRSCTPKGLGEDQRLLMGRDWGVEERVLPKYSPSQGLATLAPAHPCTGSSGAPIPGLA